MGRTIPAALAIRTVSNGDREVVVLDAETLEVLNWESLVLVDGREPDRPDGSAVTDRGR